VVVRGKWESWMLGFPEISNIFRCGEAWAIVSSTSVAKREGYWCRSMVSDRVEEEGWAEGLARLEGRS
jgi:hypothetical protein